MYESNYPSGDKATRAWAFEQASFMRGEDETIETTIERAQKIFRWAYYNNVHTASERPSTSRAE